MSIQRKGLIAALLVSLGMLGATFGFAAMLQTQKPRVTAIPTAMVSSGNMTEAGHRLFEQNCAHCHGDDARGDEGPDLHGLKKSDERIERLIQNGIKGEMPAFGKKFSHEDVQTLIGYLHTLKN
jgi:mono/diheme cytochrome c family protein